MNVHVKHAERDTRSVPESDAPSCPPDAVEDSSPEKGKNTLSRECSRLSSVTECPSQEASAWCLLLGVVLAVLVDVCPCWVVEPLVRPCCVVVD